MNNKVSFDCVATWWSSLTDSQKSAFAEDPSKVTAFLEARAKEIAESTFVTHLSDQEATKLLVEKKAYSKESVEGVFKAWRKYASDLGYTGPVVWLVKSGFTLKVTAPLAGPCYQKLGYLQDWNFEDEPTQDQLVFWIPRLAQNSKSKNVTQMEALRAQLKQTHNLPAHHCDRFGSIGLLFALILAHFKRTGERVPVNCDYAASDTLDADGGRLFAGCFDGRGLFCRYWDGSGGDGAVGFFLLGVEDIGQ